MAKQTIASRRFVLRFLSWLTICAIVQPLRAQSKPDLFPPALTQFVSDERNPLFTATTAGQWDRKIRERGWILREGDFWKMWYTGYDATPTGRRLLGYATSTDGLTWQRSPQNPLITEHWVEDVCVIHQGEMYYMFAEGEQDRAQLLTSRDGVQWTQVGRLDVRLANGKPIPDGPYGTPTAWFESGIWNLFYERSDQGIWLARSTDLKVFTNVQDEPILIPGPAAYDHDLIALNQILRINGHYYAVYHGAQTPQDSKSPMLWATGLAASDDLVHWTKCPQNPLRPVSENKSSGLLVYDGQQYRLYTMHNEVHVHFPRPVPKE